MDGRGKIMKTILDYLADNGETTVIIGVHKIRFEPCFGSITVHVDGAKQYDIGVDEAEIAQNEIQEILYENHQTEIRFCEECGKPIDEGFMAGDGDWYCCDDCFENAMNETYGKGKWRATKAEGPSGGYYVCFDGKEWEDTGIFWTSWN